MRLDIVHVPRGDGRGGRERAYGLQKDRTVQSGGVGRGEEKDIACQSEDPGEEKAVTALAPAVSEDANADRDHESGGVGRDRHELCVNRTVTHATDDRWRKVCQAEEYIATEEGHDRQNENLVEQSEAASEFE